MAAAAAAGDTAREPSGEPAQDPFEEKLIRVTIWLKKLFGDVPVPKYEVNERTVDILHEIMEFNEESDRDATLLIEDMMDQAAKYEEETEYWQSVLQESLGLSLGSLSHEAAMIATELVESAMILEAKDTSLTSFYCAINSMTWEMFEKTSKNEEMEQKLKIITKKLAAAMMMEKQLQEDIDKLEESQRIENAKSESRSKNMKFLEDKSQDMTIRIKNAEEKLIAVGLDQSLTHEAIVRFAEEVAAVKKEIEPLKKEVKSYHDLPPSMALARVMVEETRKQVKAMDDELTKELEAVPFHLT